MADLDDLSNLYLTMMWRACKNPNGDTVADGYIAVVLGVASLPYTSNDTDAQTLLPAGWSWGTTATGTACCVRNSDGKKLGGLVDGDTGNSIPIPDPMARCLAAVKVLLMEAEPVIS